MSLDGGALCGRWCLIVVRLHGWEEQHLLQENKTVSWGFFLLERKHKSRHCLADVGSLCTCAYAARNMLSWRGYLFKPLFFDPVFFCCTSVWSKSKVLFRGQCTEGRCHVVTHTTWSGTRLIWLNSWLWFVTLIRSFYNYGLYFVHCVSYKRLCF